MEWIKVRDKTPPLNEPLLFVNYKGNVTYGHCYDQHYCTENEDSTYFKDMVEVEWGYGKHWMPLPEAPHE